MKRLTGFTVEEIDEVCDVVASALAEVGPGRHGSDMKSRLFAFLAWIGTGYTYSNLAIVLDCSRSAVVRAVNHVYARIRDPLVEAYIPKRPVLGRTRLRHFPDAEFIVDVTLFEVNRPGSRDEAALYLSGKHRREGTKIQTIVNTDGLCIHMSKLYPGSFHDRKIWDLSGAERFCRMP